MEYKNTPKIVNPVVDGLREICARRASTMSYMIDEAKKRGIDDQFAWDAVYRYGQELGQEMFREIKDPTDMLEFAQHFGTGHHTDIYEMERVACDEDRLYIDFHYCPLVAAWQKLGLPESEMPELCDIAMDGDRGIISTFPKFSFELGETIAKGDDVCQIRIEKHD